MDPKEDNLTADLVQILRDASDTLASESKDTITLNSFGGGPYGWVPPGITTHYPNAHWNHSSITSPSTITTTVGTATSAPWVYSNPTGAKITLNGEGADIEVNSWSLVDAVKRIEQRLELYQPNPELEKEWEELRALGEQYRQLEQHIKDKQATFDRLKAMPAPEIS